MGLEHFRHLRFSFVALAITFLVSGCGAGSQVGSFIDKATATVANPVSATDLYRAKNVYAATLQLAVDYRTYCWAKPYATLVADPVSKAICSNRRAVVRTIQAQRPKAAAAIVTAENFIRNNPTLNAATAVAAAWQAVQDFQAAVPKTQ